MEVGRPHAHSIDYIFAGGHTNGHRHSVENPDVVSQMADSLLTYEQARWSLCTGRYRGKLHVSLRASRASARAGALLRDVFTNPEDAGGHDSIAGGAIEVGSGSGEREWEAAEQEIQSRLVKRLRIPARGGIREPFRRRGRQP